MPLPAALMGVGRAALGFGRAIATNPRVHSAAQSALGGVRSYMGSGMHRRGMKGIFQGYGLSRDKMGMFGRAFGIGFMGYEAISGFQREGVWGAAKGLASGAAYSYAFSGVLGSVAAPVTAIAGAAIGGAMLYKAGAEKGRSYMVGHRQTEFGAAVSDQFGTVSTMRRRSVMALNESRIGGGMGLGNEAMRQYQPYFR